MIKNVAKRILRYSLIILICVIGVIWYEFCATTKAWFNASKEFSSLMSLHTSFYHMRGRYDKYDYGNAICFYYGGRYNCEIGGTSKEDFIAAVPEFLPASASCEVLPYDFSSAENIETMQYGLFAVPEQLSGAQIQEGLRRIAVDVKKCVRFNDLSSAVKVAGMVAALHEKGKITYHQYEMFLGELNKWRPPAARPDDNSP